MSVEIVIEPWPQYGEDGGRPTWTVCVIEPKRTHKGLKWSERLGRFTKSWEVMHLRRSAPAAHREAVRFMQEFSVRTAKSTETSP